MAILKPVKPFVQYNNQLDPARLYSRPALPPWYQGMNGFGQARAYANKQFEYTMQQMAVSPFSVNSRAYMERIRNETGLDDTGLYDVFGTIGGVVGAGVGAALGSGFLKLPKYEGGFKFWKDGNFKKWDTDLWTGKFNPKRTSIHNTAFKSVRDIQTYNKNVDVYNNSLTKLKNLENSLGNMPSDVVKAAKDFNEASATRDLLATELSDLQTKYNKAKYRSRSNPTRVNIENRIKEVTKSIDDANIKMADVSKYGDITKVTDTLKDIDRTSDAVKTATNTLDTSVEALRASGVAVDGVTTGAKISTKTAGFIPWAGITLDTASLGISTAGLVQSIEQGDTFNIVFNTLATAADAASVVGDILEFTPAAPIGSAISIIAGVVSIGISALQGWLVGKTVGHSLSPEGMKAQQMYAENLYASMIQRPITSLATTASIVMLPLTFNALAGAKDTNILSKIGLRWVGKQLTDSAIGNQVRAGVSMLTLQGISSMTSKLDEALPWAPEDPEDVNFVSAISLYGDINDNIYGATRNKSILVGLLSGDSSAMTKALARSWGYSDEMYKSVSFDDVREAAGLELSPIGNSLFSTLGEILIDPQNYAEVAQKISMDRVTGSFVKVFNKSLDIATGKAYMQDGIGIKGTLEELVDVNGLFYNMPSKDRARTISRLFTSYLEGGKEQLQKDITALAIHRGKGSRSRNQTTVLTSVDAQFDILAKSFDDIIKGDFRYMIASDGAKTELLNSVRTYEIIKRKIANKERLSDEEFKIKDKLLTAFSHMEKIYGVEETPAFVKSFIEDLDLKLSSEHVRMLYRDFTQLQDHMGISDFFSRAIINIANPNAYLTRKSISSVRKFFEHLRYRASSTAKKAKTILKFQEVKDNLPRLITTEEVKNIYKGYSEGNKSFEDVINTAYKSNETINKLMDPAFEERIEGPRDIHTETSKQIASAKKALDDTIQTKKDKQQLVYIPTNTKFADGETVYVDEEKLPKLEEDIIKKYETGLDGKPLTREQVRAKYNRDIHSRVEAIRKEARRYKRTYDAVIEYKYHNMYYELLYDLSAQLHASISIMDIVSIAENEEYTNVLRTYTLLKTFVNSRRTITRAEKIALDMIRVEDLKKKHEDSVKALTKSIDKLKEKLETAKGVRRLDINKELITFEKDLKNSKKLLEKYTKEFDALTKSATNVKENEKIHVDIYDSYNWDMLTDENLDVFELTLRRYGIDLVVFDKDGNRVKTDNLKNTVKILKTNRDLKLQLALKESVRQIVQGIIFEYLPISDTEILMHAITNYPIAFTKEEWLKMNNLEKFEALEDYLNSLPFDSSILKHADKDVMLKIFTQINKAISSESTKVRYVQLEDVDDTVIRRAVMSKFYDMSDKDRQTVKVRSIVDAAIKQLKQASANYNTLLSTPELNDNAEFLDVLNNLIMRVNFNLTSNTAYQFFKSYFYPSFKKDTKSVNIFLSPFVKREVFPRPVYKSEKEDIKSSKTDYTEVEIINRYADARALNHEFKKVEKQWEYIKHKGTEKADLTTEEVVKEDLAERRSEREIEKNRVKSLKKRTKNSLEKTLPMFKDITVDMINNFRVGATLTDKVIYNLPFFKPYAIKNRPDLKKKLLVSILKGELEYLDLDKITFEYVPSKYGDENTKDAKGLKDYYKVLEQFRRTSPEHQNALKRLAKQLISLERSGKIFIVRDALVKVKKYDYEDDTDVLVRRIITTYKEKKSIKVESKVNKHANLKLTKLFRNSIVKSAADYMYANKGKSDLFDSKDEYLLEDIEKFLYKLTEDDIDNIDKVSEAIINKAIPIFNRYVADGIYTDAQINLKELGDNLLEFEQRDIRALSERHYVMSSDVAMKLIMGSKEMLALVDDIINFGDIEDFSIDGTYGTTLFDLAHILNSYINTNRRNKLTFNEDKVTDVRYDATKEMIMFTIDGKEVSLFDLMFVYNFNLHTISSLIKHVGLLKANNQEALDNIKDLNVRMITLYNSLYDKWGDIFSHNNFNISKELFIQTYGEDSAEDYDFLTDFNNTSTYNRLSLIDYLETDVKEFTPYEGFTGDVYEREVDKHKNMPTYLNEEAAALYRKAKKNLNNKHTYKGKPVHPRNTEELFLLYLLESDIKDKKTILENVFFPDLKVGHGKYSQTHIKELEEYLEDYKTNLEKSTTDKGKRILEQKIERLTMMLESVKARDKKVYGHNLDTFDKRFEYVLEHDGDGILSVYRNVIDTDSNEYVFALDPTTDTYYLVKHKDSKGNSNVNEDDVKGVPNYNYTIGENILKESKPDSKIFKQAVDVINKDLYWQETLGSNFEVKAVTDKSIIITVENPKLYQSVTNKLIQTIRKDTNIKNLFILTPKQLEDIQAMVDNDSTYVIDYDYKIKKNDDGSIKGLVPNMINVKGSKVKAAKYLNDLGVIIESAMHQKKKVDDVVSDMQKYAELFKNKIVVHRSYVDSVDFNKSEVFRDLYNQAKVTKAFIEFIEVIDPTKTLEAVNLDRLASMFFRNEYIRTQEDGSLADLSSDTALLNNITDINLRAQLKKITVNGTPLITLVRKSLQNLQEKYKDTNIYYTYSQVLTTEFRDTVNTLKQRIYSIYSTMSTTHKDIIKYVLPALKKKQKQGMITGITSEEVQERRRLTKKYTKAMFDKTNPKKYSHYVRQPYANVKARNEVINELKRDFYFKDPDKYNYTNEALMKADMSRLRTTHERRTREINNARNNKKREGLNLKLFWYAFKQKKNAHDIAATKSEKNNYIRVDKPYKFDFLDAEKLEVLRPFIKEAYPNFKGLFDTYETLRKDGDKDKYLPYYYSLQSIGDLHFRIDNEEDFFNVVVYNLFNSYLNKIAGEVIRKTDREINLSITMASQGLSPEEASAKLQAALEAEWNKKVDLKIKPEYRTVVIKDDDGDYEATLEDAKVHEFFIRFIHGIDDTKIDQATKAMVDVFNYFEELLFKPSDIKIHETTEDLVLKNDFKTIDEYINTLPKHLHNGARFLIDFIIYKNYDKKPSEYGLVPDNEGQIKIDLDPEKFLNIVTGILRKDRDVKFENSYEVFKLMSTPLLNRDKDFKNYVVNEYFKLDRSNEEQFAKAKAYLRQFGIDKDTQINLFNNMHTMADIISSLSYEISKDQMYALVAILNMVEERYINDIIFDNKGKSADEIKKWSWKDAYEEVTTKALAESIDKIDGLQATNVFSGHNAFGNSVLTGINDSVDFMFEHLAYVEDTNKVLNAMIIPRDNTPKEVFDLNAKYITTSESNMMTETKKFQRNLFKHIFIDEATISANSERRLQFEKVFGDPILHLIEEGNATSLENVASQNEVYIRLMELYTEVMKIVRTNHGPTQFVRMLDITTAFKSLSEHPDAVGFYSSLFDMYVSKITDQTKANKHINAVKQIEKYFNKQSFLINVNEQLAKATLGYILRNRFELKNFRTDDLVKEYLEYSKKQAEASHYLALKRYKDIAYRLNLADDLNSIVKIIYDKDETELDKDELSTVQAIMILKRAIKSGIGIDPKRLWDTYVVQLLARKESTYENLTVNETVYGKLSEELAKLDKQLDTLQRSQRARYSKRGTIDEAKKALAVLQDDLDKQVATLEDLNKEREAELKKLDKAKYQAKLNIIYYNPELLTKYIIERNTNYTDSIAKFNDKVSKMKSSYPQVFLDEHARRNNIYDKHREFFDSEEFDLFKSIRREVRLSGIDTLNTVAKKYAGTFKRLDISNINDWYSDMENKTDQVDKEQIELKKNVILKDDKGWNINYKKRAKKYDREMAVLVKEYEFLDNEYNYYLPHSFEDVDDDFKVNLVNGYLGNIIKNMKADVKDAYKKTFENHDVTFLDDTRTSELITKIEDESKKFLQNFEEKFLPHFKSINDTVKTPEEVHKYLQPLIIQYSKQIEQNGDVKVNFKSTVKQVIDKEKFKKELIDAYVNICLEIYLSNNGVKFEDLDKQTIDKLRKDFSTKIETKDAAISMLFMIKNLFVDFVTVDKDYTYNLGSDSMQMLLNNIARQVQNDKLYKKIKYYKRLHRQTLNLDSKLKENSKLLNALEDTNSKRLTNEEIILKSVHKVFEDDGILIDIIRGKKSKGIEFKDRVGKFAEYLMDDSLKKDNPTIQSIDERITKLGAKIKKAQETIDSYITYVYTNEDAIAELEAKIKDKEKLIKEHIELDVKAKEKFTEEFEYRDTNLGTYKNLYKPDENKSDDEIIEDIISISDKLYDGDLRAVIKKSAIATDTGSELHNDVVDALITRFNYIKQREILGLPVAPNFTVFDMETYDDAYGNKVPYQIAYVKQITDANGNVKLVVENLYFNSQVFFDYEDEKQTIPGELLQKFYEQQQDMMIDSDDVLRNKKEQGTLTENDVKALDKRTDALVKKIRGFKNNVAFIEVLIRELTTHSDNPIIAHNGSKFDLPNFNLFLANYATRLLPNLYYQVINDNNPRAIKDRFEASVMNTLTSDEFDAGLLKKYEEGVDKILKKVHNNDVLTENEIKLWNEFNDAIFMAKSLQVIKSIEFDFGFVIDEELKQELGKVLSDVKQYVHEYIRTSNTNTRNKIKNELVAEFEKGFKTRSSAEEHEKIVKYVEELLTKTEEDYRLLKDGSKYIDYSTLVDDTTRRGSMLSKSRVKTTSTSKDFNAKELLDNYIHVMTQIKDTMKNLKDTDINVDETLIKQQNDIAEAQRFIKDREDTITKKLEELNKLVKSKSDLLGLIETSAKEINQKINNLMYRSNKYVNSFIDKLVADNSKLASRRYNTNLLRLEMNAHLKLMNENLGKLNRAIEILSTKTDFKDIEQIKEALKGFEIDEKILSIKTEEERIERIEQYEKRRKHLLQYIENIEAKNLEGSEEFKDIVYDKLRATKDYYKKYVEVTVKEILELRNNKELVDLIGSSIEMNVDNMLDLEFYKDIYKELLDMKELKDNSTYKNLLYLLNDRSMFMTALEIYNREDLEMFTSDTVNELLIKGIGNDIKYIDNNITYLNNIDLTKKVDNEALAYKYVQQAFTKYLTQLGIIKDTDKYVMNEDIFNIVLQRDMSSDNMNEEQFKEAARATLDKTAIKQLKDSNVERIYNDALNSDDKWARMLKPELVYRTEYREFDADGEPKTRVTITVYDDEHDQVQQFWFYAENPSKVSFNLNYSYTMFDKELITKTRSVKFENKTAQYEQNMLVGTKELDVDDYIKKFYWNPLTNKNGGIIKGVSQDNILKNYKGIDASFESIKRLLMYYKKHIRTFTSDDENTRTEQLQKLYDNSISDQGLSIKHVKFENMTNRIKRKFHQYLDIYQNVKGKGNFLDTFHVYYGIINKLLGKFNAQVPGKILDMIHTDYSTMYTIVYDDETLYNNMVDLIYSSEGSAGSSSMKVTKYTTDILFRQSTHALRSLLSNTKIYGKYTSIGIINELYKQEDELTAKGEVVNSLVDLIDTSDTRLTKLLIDKYDTNKRVDVFTPNVVSHDMYYKYKNDILHKTGINLQVAFVNDPRAFEDTILVDEDDAKALGWNEGNKTWLGLYGFKGAVKYTLRKGLRKTYGATFVANASSVQSRGAYGVLLEMAFNTIRKYLNTSELHKINVDKMTEAKAKNLQLTYGITKDALKLLQTNHKQLEAEFKPVEGKIILDPNTDYEEKLLKIFGEGHLNNIEIDDVNTKGNWLKLITMKPVNPSHVFIKKQGEGVVAYSTDKDMLRGEVYVMLDSEHIAEHMSNASSIDQYGEISYVQKDLKGSVKDGVVISPSLVYTMMAKGVNWEAAFPKDNTVLEMHAEVLNFGIKRIIERNKVLDSKGVIDVIRTVQKVKQEVSGDMAKYVNEYLKTEYMLANAEDEQQERYFKLTLKEINQQVKQHALENIEGLHGSYYQSIYRKHEGIRQQVVANIDLGQGEIRIAKEGWDALLKTRNNAWVQEESVEDGTLKESVWKDLVEGFNEHYSLDDKGRVITTRKHTLKSKHSIMITFDNKRLLREYINYLNGVGIVSEYNKETKDYESDFFTVDANTNTVKFTKKGRKFGYVLAARSPVQDYNAVPILRVVGFNNHSATEANAYLYGMIGGDNDGDTIGMAAVDKEQYKHLANLDATKDEYYDDGYINKVNNKDLNFSEFPNINRIDLRYAYVGKKTYEGVRTGAFNRYNWNEIYLLAFNDIAKDYIDNIKLPTEDPQVFIGNDDKSKAYRRMYVNTIIRYMSGGVNELTGDEYLNEDNIVFTLKDYENDNKVYEFYNKFKDDIIRRYLFDTEIQTGNSEFKPLDKLTEKDIIYSQTGLSSEDKKYIKDNIKSIVYSDNEKDVAIKKKVLFNKIYNKVLQNTVTRIQTSKRGINEFGGTRKGVLQSSVLSAFANINKDKKGIIWNDFRVNKDPNEAITPESIALSIVSEKFYNNLVNNINDYNDYDDFVNDVLNDNLNKDYKNTFARKDLIEVLKFVYENYINRQQVKDELESLANALMNYTPNSLLNHFSNQKGNIKQRDPLIKAMLNRINTSGEEQELTKVDKTILKVAYFGRFKKEANQFFKLIEYKDKPKLQEFINKLADQYIKQHLIDRRQFNVTSKNANLIISLSKHAGIDIDPIRFLRAFSKRIRTQAAQNSIRHIGVSEKDHGLLVAMAMEQDRFERDNAKIYDNELSDEYKELFKEYTPPQIKEFFRKDTAFEDARANLNSLIKDSAKVELFGKPFVPDSVYKEVEKDIINICNILNEVSKDTTSKRIDVRKALEYKPRDGEKSFEDSIKNLLRFNIPSYRVKRLFDIVFSLYKSVNNVYFSSTGSMLNKNINAYTNKGLLFYELLHYFYIPQERADFEFNFNDSKYVLDFFLNTADVDPNLIAVDEETGDISKIKTSDYNRNLLITPREYGQEVISNLSKATRIPSTDEIVFDDYERLAFKKVMNELDLVSANKSETLEDAVNKIISEFITFNNIYSDKSEMIKDIKESGIKTKRELEVYILNKHIYNYSNLSNFVGDISDNYNKYKNVENQIKELEYNINTLKLQIRSKEKIIDTIQGKSEYYASIKDKQNILNKLEILLAEYQKMINNLDKQISDYAFNSHFKNGFLLLASSDGRNYDNIYSKRPRLLTQDNIDQIKNQNILHMDKYQAPFENVLNLYAIKDDNNNIIGYDWDKMYEWYKKNNRIYRLTVVMNAFDDETLLKKLNHIARKEDTETYGGKKHKELSKFQKALPWNYAKHKRATRFKNVEDLQTFMEELNEGKQEVVILGGKKYTKSDASIKLDQHITPTLKEIDIRSAEDLKEVYEFIKTDDKYMIGFSDLNSVLSAMQQSYIPYQFEGRFSYIIAMLQQSQKLLMRLTPGFLLRNLLDTYNQLFSQMHQELGMAGIGTKRSDIWRHFKNTFEIYDVYKGLSEERIMTLTQLDNMLLDIELIFKKYDNTGISNITQKDFDNIHKNIETIKGAIDTYVDNAKSLRESNNANGRIKGREERAKLIQSRLQTTLEHIDKLPALSNIAVVRNKPELQEAMKFLLNINFAEYYLMFDDLMLDSNTSTKFRTKISKIIEEHKERGDINDFKQILFEISAFMNTQAQIDVYKQETYKYLYEINERRKEDLDGVRELEYAQVKQLLNIAKEENVSALYKATLGWNAGKLMGWYTTANEWIENVARINGFLFNRYIYGYNFGEAVNDSLKHWFNYGQRSPIEMQLITDIPYLSFPIRSIDNWIDRLLSPSYIKLMSDLMDGIYSQFADEDGQYDEFTKFQMMNGWIPIGNSFGLRVGHGALDLQSIISNPTELIGQRMNPLLRGVQTLINNGDFVESIKRLATTGALTRVANMVGPRETLQQTPVVQDFVTKKPRSVGTTLGFTYDRYEKDEFTKYTPYKYRNGNNGRYTRYENIYRDWFNKYGRMRKPKVDPMSLVKDIQWRQYVRWRRSNNMT